MEGEMVIKLTEDAPDSLMSAMLVGDGTIEGDYQMITNMSMDTGSFKASTTLEQRQVDGTSYIQHPYTGEWEIDRSGTSSPFFEIDDFGQIDPESLEDLTVELDALDGLPMYLITDNTPDEPGYEEAQAWVGVHDLLIHQMQMIGHPPAYELGGMVPLDAQEVFASILFRFSRFNEPVVIAAPDRIWGPFGSMAFYESDLHPFSIQRPADWTYLGPDQEPDIDAYFENAQGASLSIVEEDLIEEGIGELTREEYIDRVISTLSSTVPGFELISQDGNYTMQMLTVDTLEASGSGPDGDIRITRLVYLHEGRVAFNATFIADKEQHQELEGLISYTFRTFNVEGAAPFLEAPFEEPAPAPTSLPQLQYPHLHRRLQ